MSQDDRRQTQRHNLPMEMEFWCDSTHHRGRIEDLSEGGAYVYSVLNWPSGTQVRFSFVVPGSEKPVTGTGTVVWSEFMGFGVRFDTLEEAGRERIRELVGASPTWERRGAELDERLEIAADGVL